MKKKNILDAIFLICGTKIDAERKRQDLSNLKVTVRTPVEYMIELCNIMGVSKPISTSNSFYTHADHNKVLYEFVMDKELDTEFSVSIDFNKRNSNSSHYVVAFQIDRDLIDLYLERVNNNA